MTESIVSRGHDTWATSNFPNNEQWGAKYLKLHQGTIRSFVYLPLPSIAGRTVLSATLTMHVRGTWAAQTLTVARISEDLPGGWATLNWNNQPATTGAVATVTTGALANHAEVSVDVTALLQSVANGSKWFGFRVSTSVTTDQVLYGFKSGQPAWVLTYELSDAPEQPTMLSPNGGVVSLTKPTVSWDFTDFGGATEQASAQVQIDPLGAGGGAADFDSGEVATPDPELDLSTTTYPGFSTAGGSTQWRVRVKDQAGLWSAWSDWATWTYRAKSPLVMDSPAGSTLSDPSPVILAHITSGTLANYRIRVADGTDRTRIRYDSHKRPASGTSISHTIPLKNEDGDRVFVNNTNYWLNVRYEDTYDREGTVGDTVYVDTWVLVTFSDNGAVAAPVLSSVTQPGELPRIQLVWTRTSAPDAWVILKNGDHYARLDPADVSAGGGTYTWLDPDFTAAFQQHSWKVKAIVNGSGQGPASNSMTITPALEGVWLVDLDGNGVQLRGTETDDWQQLDRAAIYKPLRRAVDVVIIDGQEGLSGTYKGDLQEETNQSRATALARLGAIKDDPTAEVWLLAADLAIKVRLLNLTYKVPGPESMSDDLVSSVSFRFGQSSGIEYGTN